MKKLKIITDIFMFADFLFLMCHEAVQNLSLHGIFGIVLFALFIFHHILNAGFYKNTFRGKYNSRRVLFSLTTWILFALMILMAFSSVMLSSSVFDFSSIPVTIWARPLHTFSSIWGFLIMGFHLGLHLHSKLQKIENLAEKSQGKIAIYIVEIFIFAVGIFCIIRSQIYLYLFLLSPWKFASGNIFICFGQYLGMTAMMIVLAHFIFQTLKN
jgi:hypothetical protein